MEKKKQTLSFARQNVLQKLLQYENLKDTFFLLNAVVEFRVIPTKRDFTV